MTGIDKSGCGRRKPRITYLINSLDSGGAESGLVRMVREGVFENCELSIVALARGKGSVEAELREAGCDPQFLLRRSRMRLIDLPILFVRLCGRLLRNSPDAVIASLPQANLLARLSAMLMTRVLFVSFEHNTHLARRAYEIGYRLTSHRVDWVLADSQTTLDTALQRLYRRPPPKHTVMPLVLFSAHSHDECSPHLQNDRMFQIANAGRFTSVKNQAALIEAVAMLQHRVALTLYGDGPTREHCMALASRLGVADRVRFPGFVPNWASRPADLFVLPSLHEGLCIVVLEAMNAGIPVVAPMIGGLRDYAEPGLIRVLDAIDAPAIARAICESIEDRAAGRAMAIKAKEMIQRRFSDCAVRSIYSQFNQALIEAVRVSSRTTSWSSLRCWY